MTKRYLIMVKDKSNLKPLNELGYVMHVAKLSNLVTFETDLDTLNDLERLPNVVSVKEAQTVSLA